MSQSHAIMTKVTCVGTAGLFITNMVLFDASKYKNEIISYKQFFFLELIWLAIIIVPMVVLIHNVFWSFTHIILLIVYTSLCLDFLYSSIDSNNQLVPATVLIDIFIKKQNYYYNQLLITERQLSPITLAGYIIGSLMADFALFYGLFIKTGSVLFNVLTITLGIVAFGALTLLNIIAATTVDKVKKCRLMNYWIIRSGQSKTLSSQIKLIAIFERLSTHPVGFFVGRLFVIDNHRFLLFLLENISILLLFITNMTRLWKN
ncbi:uncharacterized protein LOC107368325 [Tetranychus urticae]|nr:uncharacterized protein LOC107368325 [Tetranychus urticae]